MMKPRNPDLPDTRFVRRFGGFAACLILVSPAMEAAPPAGVVKPAGEAPEGMVEDLRKAYERLDGFTAEYRLTSKARTMKCTLGMDMASGAGFLRLVPTSGDDMEESAIWSAPHDRMYTSGGGDLLVFKGMTREVQSIRRLSAFLKGSADEDGSEVARFTPSLLLEKTGVAAALGVSNLSDPPWMEVIKGFSAFTSDDETVTFITQDSGSITISRENGMIRHQSLPGEAGEERVMDLHEFAPNPGKDVILAWTSTWPTEGAEERAVVSYMAPLRLGLIRLVIDGVEGGKVSNAELEEFLEEEYESLRHFAKGCIDETEGPFASKPDWATLMQNFKDSILKKWRESKLAEGADDSEAFKDYISQVDVQRKIRDGLVKVFLNADRSKETIMLEIFGRGGLQRVKVNNERGAAARKLIEEALARAYLEALIESKMIRYWQERDGLD